MQEKISRAAEIIKASRSTIAMTGAGISVESGIAPFRGPGGIWTKHDPEKFDKGYFRRNPGESWELIKMLFYEHMGKAKPNPAHLALADMEDKGLLDAVITQNIDNLHQDAGSRNVYEFHGTLRLLDCLKCRNKHPHDAVSLETLPPACPDCGGVLKPDIVFFGEPIPEDVNRAAVDHAGKADVMLVIGTTGEIMPASRLPLIAQNAGATIIEVNVQPSAYTPTTTDIFLQGRAGEILSLLAKTLEA